MEEIQNSSIDTNVSVKRKPKKYLFLSILVIFVLLVGGTSAYYFMSSTESLTKEVIEENIVKIQLKAVEKIEAQKDKFKNINSFVNGNFKISANGNIAPIKDLISNSGENPFTVTKINGEISLNDYKVVKNGEDSQFSTTFKLVGDVSGGMRESLDFLTGNENEMRIEGSSFVDLILKNNDLYIGIKDLKIPEIFAIQVEPVLAQPPFSDLKAGKYLKIPEVGKYLEQASSFDYKKVLADLKTSAEKPFFEVKEEIEGKFYLQPTKNLCEGYVSGLIAMNPIYAIFMQGGCSDVMYKSMLESFDEAGKFYVSGTTSEWKIVYEGIGSKAVVPENSGYVAFSKNLLGETKVSEYAYDFLAGDDYQQYDLHISFKNNKLAGKFEIGGADLSGDITANLNGTSWKDFVLDYKYSGEGEDSGKLTIADKKFALENNLNVKNQVKSMANISGTFDKDGILNDLDSKITAEFMGSQIFDSNIVIKNKNIDGNINLDLRDFFDEHKREAEALGQEVPNLENFANGNVSLKGNYTKDSLNLDIEGKGVGVAIVNPVFVGITGSAVIYTNQLQKARLDTSETTSTNEVSTNEILKIFENISGKTHISFDKIGNKNDFNFTNDLLLNNESLLKLEIDNKATIETEKIPEVTVPSNVSDFDLSDL